MNKQKNQLGFAHLMIITVILGLALIGSLGFVFYQNFIQKKDAVVKNDVSSKTDSSENGKDAVTDEKANWKTYTNEAYRFSFRYPADWTIRESAVEKSNNVPTPTPAIEAVNPNSDDIRVFINKVGVGGWGIEQPYGSIGYDSKIDAGKIVLSGRNRFAGGSESGGYLISFQFEENGYSYNFLATGEDEGRMDSADITFNQIISTWQFK